MKQNNQRSDFEIISNWINEESKVLDLGCGDGSLLNFLEIQKKITGFGIEKDKDNWLLSLKNNIDVIQMDLEAGLSGFEDNSFDVVILSKTIQSMHNIEAIMKEMHRVGREVIVTFPNFGYWRDRIQILMGHITEHLAMKYQQEMMQMINDPQMQQALLMAQQQGQPLPMEMQNQIAMMAANASDKVLQFDEEKAKIMAGQNPSPEEERMELQKQDLALRAQGEMNRLKIHQDKMDLEEAKLMTTDENEDEDRALRLKEAEMRFASDMAKDAAKTMDAAVKITKI